MVNKKRVVLKFFLILIMFFSVNLISGVDVNITTQNNIFSYVNISSVQDLYAYEVSFLYASTNRTVNFSNFFGSTLVSRGNSMSYSDHILSVYESMVNSSQEGIDSSGAILFNITHTNISLSLRSLLLVYSNGTEIEKNYCIRQDSCTSWSACSNGAQTRTCTDTYCYFADRAESQSCTVQNNPSGSSGGGGASRVSFLDIESDIPQTTSDGKIKVKINIKNTGDYIFNDLTLSGYVTKDSKLVDTADIQFSQSLFKKFNLNQEQSVLVTVNIKDDELSFYELIINVTSSSPSYSSSEKVILTLLGKEASQTLNSLVFTDELINEHPECLELKDMIIKAQEEYKAGNKDQALKEANLAIEACKKYIEQGSSKKSLLESSNGRLFFYLASGLIFAILLGIIFNLIKIWKFKHSKLD